jgi:TfoX/Sxy family transcriptional regulator of competence genes
MTAEESLSVAVRGHLSRAGVMSEVKMFGGTGFMLNRNLVAAVSKRGLLLRVGKDATVTLLRGQGRDRWR